MRLDKNDILGEVENWITSLRDRAHMQYAPISFWDGLNTYVEMAVEKLGLRNLFEAWCKIPHPSTQI